MKAKVAERGQVTIPKTARVGQQLREAAAAKILAQGQQARSSSPVKDGTLLKRGVFFRALLESAAGGRSYRRTSGELRTQPGYGILNTS